MSTNKRQRKASNRSKRKYANNPKRKKAKDIAVDKGLSFTAGALGAARGISHPVAKAAATLGAVAGGSLYGGVHYARNAPKTKITKKRRRKRSDTKRK